jgi:hypothetical protein
VPLSILYDCSRICVPPFVLSLSLSIDLQQSSPL